MVCCKKCTNFLERFVGGQQVVAADGFSVGIREELNRLTFNNLESNKLLLDKVGRRIDDYLEGVEIEEYERNLFSEDIGTKNWVNSQYFAARKQIEKIVNPDSYFNRTYENVHTKLELLRLTRNIILDLYDLNEMTGLNMGMDGGVSRNTDAHANGLFNKAKFAYSEEAQKRTFSMNDFSGFQFSLIPALIRQAIELKLKDMIGFVSAKKRGKDIRIGISQIISFFEENDGLIYFSVKPSILGYVNRWANSFMHEGVISFSWQSLEAIDLVEDFFSIQHEETGAIDTNGFVRFYDGVSLHSISERFKESTGIDLVLDRRKITVKPIGLM